MTVKAELVNPERLTPREGEIATLMAEGLSDKDIARVLAISIKTVSVHAANIYEKLGLRSRSINTRCTAIITMIARGMITLSLRSMVMVMVFNVANPGNDALRIKGARFRVTHSSVCRRASDA